ncbi:MAG: triphosphoribosyl-dephospho-CoA synthase CitG, partial [Oscillospiraceae bacterium]|nr:triphosphoribosyl-dephospho-CoA synthase CitG [Oscillospiraceae bacterium]
AKIYRLLEQNGIETIKAEQIIEKTGVESYIALQQNPIKIKRLMVQIEDNFALGRLFDIDVIKPDGEKVSRADIGMPGRNCMICGSEGASCARSRKHTVEELQQHFIKCICDYFNDMHADHIAQQAVKALLYEVSVTPKPGLVDRADNGAHKDMDFYTFINSSTALYDYFKKCALKAVELSDSTPQQLFENLRYLGLEAESKMFQHTFGVNTHKGAIFSFGIIIAATAYLSENGKDITVENVLDTCAQMAQLSLTDFEEETHKSFGKELFSKQKIKGIRGQAAEGYPAVKPALKYLKDCLAIGNGFDKAGAKTLCMLMSELEDTNVIKRSDVETLKEIQNKAKELLKDNDIQQSFELLNKEFISKNISPGGCADLLAVCFLLYFICDQ